MPAAHTRRSPVLINASTTANLNYDSFFVDATNGNVVLTLPNASGLDGINLLITRIDHTMAHIVTIQPFAGQTINGYPSEQIGQNAVTTIMAFANKWYTI